MNSPVQKLEEDVFLKRQLEVYIKRDDLMYGALHGNKFRKLKYHLRLAQEQYKSTLITCGGPFSNHLFAVAAAGLKHEFQTVGIVRGAYHRDNPTIMQIRAWKMRLLSINRSDYALRNTPDFASRYLNRFPRSYFIPEGGNHALARKGVMDIIHEAQNQISDVDFWMCPVGTGCTAAGLYEALNQEAILLAFSVLKGFDTMGTVSKILHNEIRELMGLVGVNAHWGGFGKRNSKVEDFCTRFYDQHRIMLDPIYMGKMMLRLYDMIEADYFPKKSRLMILHTGGSQGIWGYNHRYATNLPAPDRLTPDDP